MQRIARPESLEFPPLQLQRIPSLNGGRTPSTSGSLAVPPSVTPEPAYIAASAAAQIVNSDRANRGFDNAAGEEEKAELDNAVVSPGSLTLVNSFLDHLLFSFLASARSTAIASLRPAILEVLKPRLGKDTIEVADEELQGYLAGDDAEELFAFDSGQEFKGEHNLIVTWRRTRLRCMVYTRLGDMEEDDEDAYLKQEVKEDANDGRPRLARDLGSVSPAAAIFLTAILESLGEQALLIASEASYNRAQVRRPQTACSRALVEEVDMEKIAFNPTLGRLWRSWKKFVRPSSLTSPRLSREIARRKAHSVSGGESANRNQSISEEAELGYFDSVRRPSVAEVLQRSQSSDVVSHQQEDGLPEEHKSSSLEARNVNGARPRSMIEYPNAPAESTRRLSSTSNLPKLLNVDQKRPIQKRQRSASLPVRQTPYVSPVDETFTTPNEAPDPFVRENERVNAEKQMPSMSDDLRSVNEGNNGNLAISTMYDGAISQGSETLPIGMAERTNRGISTYTESSNYTDEYDQDMAPQALNFKKNMNDPSTGSSEGASGTTLSYRKSRVGGIDANTYAEGSVQNLARKENQTSKEDYSDRGDILEQSDGDNSRQHVGTFADLATLSGHQLRTYDDSGKAVKRDIPVLYEAPSNQDVIYDPQATMRSSNGLLDEEEPITPTETRDMTSTNPQSGPQVEEPSFPLSPKSTMDTTQATAGDAPSSSSSDDTSGLEAFTPTHRYQGSNGHRNGSPSSRIIYKSSEPTPTASSLDVRAKSLAVNTGAERAAVQRVSPSSVTPLTSNGRTSASSNRPLTASSSTSQMSSKIKGMIGRESGDLIRQPMPRQDSSEGSVSLISGSQRITRSMDREQDFEDLIKSDETVKYTLTPQNMRDIEKPDSPRWKTQSHSGAIEPAELTQTSGPSSPSSARSLTKLKGLNGLRSNPTNGVSPTSMSNSPSSPVDPSKLQPKVPLKYPGPRSPGPIARDADARDDSLGDFNDFIRSTGPDSPAMDVVKSVPTKLSKSSRPTSSGSSAVNGFGKPSSKKITKQAPSAVTKRPEAAVPRVEAVQPKKSGIKLQAREPTVSNDNATADLAEFLRSSSVGGQLDSRRQLDGSRRSQQTESTAKPIPGLNSPTNGTLEDAVKSGSSVASTQGSFAPSKMTQSSINSRTGLLENTNRGSPVTPSAPRNESHRPLNKADTIGPVRTQARIHDPYAIDNDSDDGYGTPQPPEREEESLSDFLRNYQPSPSATVTRETPEIADAPKSAKPTGPTIRERIARNIAVIPDYRPLPPKAPKKSSASKSSIHSNESRRSAQRTSSATGHQASQSPDNSIRGRPTNNGAPQLPPLNHSNTSPHLASQPPKPAQTMYTKQINRLPKQMQAREEGGALNRPAPGSGMSDLANFLKETEPPAAPPSRPTAPLTPPKEKEESSTLGRMFGRKKKDMKR